MATVVLHGVSKVFPGGVTAVRQLDLEVRDRELMVLVGPSGCGKTTTLRLIAGLEQATGGEIRVDSAVVNRVPARDRNIAMVFQNGALYPHWTVYRNLAFGLELRYGRNWLTRVWRRLTAPAEAAKLAAQRRAIGQQVCRTAEVLGIKHLLDRMPRQLSGGERQRVALGRAMVRQPAVFLLDEPLSNLDAPLRVEMRRELRQLHGRLQTTMVYVTHDQIEALTLGERMAVMQAGAIQQVGTPAEVCARPRHREVARFVGFPPMNLVPGRIEQGGGGFRFRAPGVAVDLPQVPLARPTSAWPALELGVRPENVRLAPHADPDQPPLLQVHARGNVSLIERLGSCQLVHVEIAGSWQGDNNVASVLVSVADSRASIRAGERVGLRFDLQRLQWFDAQSGMNLTAGNAQPADRLHPEDTRIRC